jgi:hypothetical protein
MSSSTPTNRHASETTAEDVDVDVDGVPDWYHYCRRNQPNCGKRSTQMLVAFVVLCCVAFGASAFTLRIMSTKEDTTSTVNRQESNNKERAVMSPKYDASDAELPHYGLELRTGGLYTVFAEAAATFGAAATTHGDIGVVFGAGTIGATIIHGQYQFHNTEAAGALGDISQAREEAAAWQASVGSEFMITGGSLSGMVLAPGVYDSVGALTMAASTTLTFDGQGDPTAFWILRINGALTLGASAQMRVIRGGCPGNIFFVAKGAVSFGASSTVLGTSLALGAVTTGANVASGPLLSSRGAATIGAGSTIFSYCRAGNQSYVSENCAEVEGCPATTGPTPAPTTKSPTTKSPTTKSPTTKSPTTKPPTPYYNTCMSCMRPGGCPPGFICGMASCGGAKSCLPINDCPVRLTPPPRARGEYVATNDHSIVIPRGTHTERYLVSRLTSVVLTLYPNPDEPDQLWGPMEYSSIGTISIVISSYGRNTTIHSTESWGVFNTSGPASCKNSAGTVNRNGHTNSYDVNTDCYSRDDSDLCGIPRTLSVRVADCVEWDLESDRGGIFQVFTQNTGVSYGMKIAATMVC